MEHIIDNALKRSGVRKPGEVHLSHGFRKFFVTQCESSPMKSLHVSMLAGHDTGLKKVYHKPSDSVVLEDYMIHASNALTIDTTQKLQTRVMELEVGQAQEIAQLKEQIKKQAEFSEMLKDRLRSVDLWDSCDS
jgi:hypothetical protein